MEPEFPSSASRIVPSLQISGAIDLVDRNAVSRVLSNAPRYNRNAKSDFPLSVNRIVRTLRIMDATRGVGPSAASMIPKNAQTKNQSVNLANRRAPMLPITSVMNWDGPSVVWTVITFVLPSPDVT